MWDGMGYEVQKSHSDIKPYFVWLFRQHLWWHNICHWTALKRLAWIFCLVRCSFSTRALKQNGQEMSTYVLPRTNSNHTSFWKNKKAETRERVLQNDVFHRWWSFHDVKLLSTSPYSSRTCLYNLKLDQVWKVTIHISTFSGCFGKAHSFTFPKSPSRLETMPRSEFFQFDTAVRIPWRSAWGGRGGLYTYKVDGWPGTSVWWWKYSTKLLVAINIYICQGK